MTGAGSAAADPGGPAPIPVSVAVLTLNEAANLPACLDSAARFAERIVIDSDSTDGTPEIARARGARVVRFRWTGGYPKKKQWTLDTVGFACRWLLFLDADERVTPALADELAALFAAGPPRHAGYVVTGRPVFLGRVLAHGQRFAKIALVRRDAARFQPCPDLDVATMWEVEGHYQPVIDGTVGRLGAPLLHADARPLYAWFERHNRYSDWEATLGRDGRLDALAALETPGRRRLKRLFHRLPGRPLWVFVYSFIIRFGWLDGGAGFHFAVARAFYYWQIAVKRRALELAAAQHVVRRK